jgi:hypothetical protein
LARPGLLVRLALLESKGFRVFRVFKVLLGIKARRVHWDKLEPQVPWDNKAPLGRLDLLVPKGFKEFKGLLVRRVLRAFRVFKVFKEH